MRIKLILAICAVPLAYCLLPSPCLFAAFKDTGWGARPVAMGGAFTAVGGDTNCMLYNPAGLVTLENIETSYMYSKLYTGLDGVNLGLNYAAFAYPFDAKYGTVGISWANFVSENEYTENTFNLSYARNAVPDWLDAGINIKMLNHAYTLDKYALHDPVFANGTSKGAMALDLGFTSPIPIMGSYILDVGLALKNINSPDVGLASVDKVPAEVRLGAACKITENIMPTLDISYRLQEWGTAADKMNVHLGGEACFLDRVFAARAGANMNEVALGFGYSPALFDDWDFQIDYSFILPLAVKSTSGSHRVSLVLRFFGEDDPGEAKAAPAVKKVVKEVPVKKEQAVRPVKPPLQQSVPVRPSGRVRAVIPVNDTPRSEYADPGIQAVDVVKPADVPPADTLSR